MLRLKFMTFKISFSKSDQRPSRKSGFEIWAYKFHMCEILMYQNIHMPEFRIFK